MTFSPEDLRHRLLPILLAQGVGLACGIASVQLTSHLVAPADFGLYGVFVSLASVGAGVIYAGLVKFVSRHWRDTTDRAGLIREILAATLRRIPWLILASALAGWMLPARPSLSFGALFFGCALLLAFMQLAQSALQAAREHWRDLGVAATTSVTRSFTPPLLYAASGLGLTALLAGFFLQALVGASLGALAVRRWWPSPAAGTSAKILTPVYDGPQFVALALAGWMLAGLNRWLVAWLFGPEAAGYFTLAGNIGLILPSMLGMVILQYFQPLWFAANPATPDERRRLLAQVDRVALVYTVLAVGLAAVLHRAMPLLVGTLVSPRYAEAARFVFVTGCATTSLTVGFYYHALLLAARRERACSTVDLGGGACLMAGSMLSIAGGMEWFRLWLAFSPLVPWAVNRTLARRALLASA